MRIRIPETKKLYIYRYYMPKTVVADSLTKDGRFFTNHALEEINGKTRKKNSRGRKTPNAKRGRKLL